MSPDLTTRELAAQFAWWLAHGEALPLLELRQRFIDDRQLLQRTLAALRAVLVLDECDDALTADRLRAVRGALSPVQAAARASWLLASTPARLTATELAPLIRRKPATARKLLVVLARVIPIWRDHQWRWGPITGEEEEK